MMTLTGKELYEIYARKMEYYGVMVDPWDDLEDTDRKAWAATAIEAGLCDDDD
jgi:hypothetical protein